MRETIYSQRLGNGNNGISTGGLDWRDRWKVFPILRLGLP